MAIRPLRKRAVTDINFRLAEVAEKGQLVTYDVANTEFVQVQVAISGVVTTKCAGVLLFDVVDKDFGARPVNFQRLETGISGHVRLLKQGELELDRVAAGAVFGPGSGVFLHNNGNISNTQFIDPPSTVVEGNERVGTALSTIDADGFVEVYFEIE